MYYYFIVFQCKKSCLGGCGGDGATRVEVLFLWAQTG